MYIGIGDSSKQPKKKGEGIQFREGVGFLVSKQKVVNMRDSKQKVKPMIGLYCTLLRVLSESLWQKGVQSEG